MITEMIQAAAYEAVPFSLNDVKDRIEPAKVLMCAPDYFDVVDVKNVHMEGNAGAVDKVLAQKQWQTLHGHYRKLVSEGFLEDVQTIAPAPGCEDMVFTANQSFPWLLNGKKTVVLSKMRHPSRMQEVPHFKTFYESFGYQSLALKHTDMFEGMGDTILHPGKALLYGGYGHRTNKNAYDELSAMLDVPVILLELIDPRFYHLDTCFVPLDQHTVMLCPQAFSYQSFENIKKMFSNVIRIPATEAVSTFALNAHVLSFPDHAKKVALIQYGSVLTYYALEEAGYEIVEVDTSEFMKSGGSVFCMKMMMY